MVSGVETQKENEENNTKKPWMSVQNATLVAMESLHTENIYLVYKWLWSWEQQHLNEELSSIMYMYDFAYSDDRIS